MKSGNFLFITDAFYTKYDPYGRLMKNRGENNKRPCFYAFQDKKEPNIFWCVPISSKVQKYERIVQKKISGQVSPKSHKIQCNTIVFGNVLGQKKAFLIQNMFPVTAAYVSSIYIDKNTRNPVTIDPATEKYIVKNAKKVLSIVFRGHSNIIFTNAQEIYKDLTAQLYHEQQ